MSAAVIVHDLWRDAPEVAGLDEFAAKMEEHGLRVHHVYCDCEDGGYWSIEVERTRKLPDGRVHLTFMTVSPQFVSQGMAAGHALVPEMLEREQARMIQEEAT
jgi:hypothetical protein